jgi:hypothetical protein
LVLEHSEEGGIRTPSFGMSSGSVSTTAVAMTLGLVDGYE